jgi:hypothetical protein
MDSKLLELIEQKFQGAGKFSIQHFSEGFKDSIQAIVEGNISCMKFTVKDISDMPENITEEYVASYAYVSGTILATCICEEKILGLQNEQTSEQQKVQATQTGEESN